MVEDPLYYYIKIESPIFISLPLNLLWLAQKEKYGEIWWRSLCLHYLQSNLVLEGDEAVAVEMLQV